MYINTNFNMTYTAKNETTATTTVLSSETTASEALADTGISQPQKPVFSSAVIREITTPTIIASYSQPTTVASVPLTVPAVGAISSATLSTSAGKEGIL